MSATVTLPPALEARLEELRRARGLTTLEEVTLLALERGTELLEADWPTLVRLGDEHDDRGQREVARELYARAARAGCPEATAQHRIAESWRKDGAHEPALAAYERALDSRPDDAWALAGKAECLRRLGRCDEAVPIFEQALEQLPEHTFALQGLAASCAVLGDHRRAVRLYQQALAREDSSFARDGLESLRASGVRVTPEPAASADD